MPRKAKAGKFKLKTHKATSKRFRLTGGGKLMRTKGGKSHLRRNRSRRTRLPQPARSVAQPPRLCNSVWHSRPCLYHSHEAARPL